MGFVFHGFVSLAVVCLIIGLAGCGDARKPTVEGGAGERGSSDSSSELSRENNELRDQLARAQEQISSLQRELAEARIEYDVQNAKPRLAESRTAARDVSAADLLNMRILEMNRDMKVAVVSGGASAGVKTGMKFHVLRDDQVIAQLRVVNVRESIAGGLIEQVNEDRFPEMGDKVILSSKQD